MFGNDQSNHRALKVLIDKFELQFVGWSVDDERWEILSQIINFKSKQVKISVPSDILPYVQFSINSFFTSTVYFYDPKTDKKSTTPQVPLEHVVKAARIADCVLKTEIEFSVRKQISKILTKDKAASNSQMAADFLIYESVVQSSQQLSIQRLKTQDTYENWKLVVENVKSKKNEVSLSESNIEKMAGGLVFDAQNCRDLAFADYIKTPSYPNTSDATKFMDAYSNSRDKTVGALEGILSLVHELEDKRKALNDFVAEENSLRRDLGDMVEKIQTQLISTQSVTWQLNNSLKVLKNAALVTEFRSKLEAQATKQKIDPRRVLAAVDKECDWIGVHPSTSPQKKDAISMFEGRINTVSKDCLEIAIEIDNTKKMVSNSLATLF